MRSAQWMSSTSSTKGRRSAEISSARLTAQNVSSAENDSSISPIADPTRWVTSSWPGSIAASLTRAASKPSSAPIPAAARTISADRPVRDAFSVREAASLQRGGVGAHPFEELLEEAGLAHPRRAEDRHDVAAVLLHRLMERLVQDRELLLAPDDGQVEAARVPVVPARHADQQVRGDQPGLALEWQRLDLLDDHGVAHQLERRLADQDLHRRRVLLEASGGVHRVAGHQALSA